MIGKKEWNEMAQQVDSLEKRMEAFYENLAGRLKDPELKKVFMQLSSDEREHSEAIKNLAENIMES